MLLKCKIWEFRASGQRSLCFDFEMRINLTWKTQRVSVRAQETRQIRQLPAQLEKIPSFPSLPVKHLLWYTRF